LLDIDAAILNSPSPMDRALDAFEHALDAERRRNAQQIALFRAIAAFVLLGANMIFTLMRSSYVGVPIASGAVYCGAALLVWLAHSRFPQLAQRGALWIALIDMPYLFSIIAPLSVRLRQLGFVDDSAAVGVQLAFFYIALILLASLSLEARYTWLAACIALVLQTWLFMRGGRDFTFTCIMALTTLMVTGLALYSDRRSVALVKSAADEQTRRERLGRYFSPQVAEALTNVERVPGEGSNHEVSVLFADIRNFTERADALPSEAVVRLLNDFHSRMVECVFRHGGTLDKYLGDGLMAYFGAPVEQADHAERAVRCALDMQRALDEMNRDLEQRGVAELAMGIGVHSGQVVLGDIGAETRREYTVIGDTVNVAARVEQLTKVCKADVLVTDETRRRVAADLDFIAVEPLAVKGKSAPLQTYRIKSASTIG
jgi:class 3 adenylate cyclase